MESLHKWQILRGKSSHEITLSNNQYLRTAWRLGLGDSSMEQDVFLAWITEIMKLFWTLPLIFCFTSSKTLTILVFLLWCFSLTCYFNISFRVGDKPNRAPVLPGTGDYCHPNHCNYEQEQEPYPSATRNPVPSSKHSPIHCHCLDCGDEHTEPKPRCASDSSSMEITFPCITVTRHL